MLVSRMAGTMAVLTGAALTAVACSDGTGPSVPSDDGPGAATAVGARGPGAGDHLPLAGRPPYPVPDPGRVYLMSNAAGPNEVLVFRRGPDGSLESAGAVATGGSGAGAGLGNQGAVTLTEDGRFLLVVNPGSDDVSVFAVGPGGIRLTDVEPSGGAMPISVAVHRRLVYVLNGGAPNGIAGFRLHPDGTLSALPGSDRPLSGPAVGPAQVGFVPGGRALVVTEKGTNTITTYAVGRDGLASPPMPHPAAGETPFGFAFDRRGRLIVSEAFGGAPDASTASAYAVDRNGDLRLLDGPEATTETAACWVAIPSRGTFAYTTNTGSGSVTGFRIDPRGDLTRLDADGVTGVTGPGSMPIDAAFSRDGRFLYVLGSGSHELTEFRLGPRGGLTALGAVSGLPAAANGLAAR